MNLENPYFIYTYHFCKFSIFSMRWQILITNYFNLNIHTNKNDENAQIKETKYTMKIFWIIMIINYRMYKGCAFFSNGFLWFEEKKILVFSVIN